MTKVIVDLPNDEAMALAQMVKRLIAPAPAGERACRSRYHGADRRSRAQRRSYGRRRRSDLRGHQA